MTTPATVAASLTYTSPGGPANGATPSFSAAFGYDPQEAGTIDIPIGTVGAVAFVLSFGTIANAGVLVVKNRHEADLGVRINGAVADQFSLVPGGFLILSGASSPTVPLTACSVVTTVVAPSVAVGHVDYYVFGAT